MPRAPAAKKPTRKAPAHTSSRTTWLLYSDSLMGAPLASLSVKSGATFRSEAVGAEIPGAAGARKEVESDR
jgi:hypothetical protein